MPIPHLNKNQNWRNRAGKKYYIKRSAGKFNKRKKSPNDKNLWQRIKIKLLIFISVCFVLGVMFMISVFLWLSNNLPDPNKLQDRNIAQSTKIFDRSGEEVLYEIYGEEERTLVTLEEIPDHVEWAIISMEDKNFYNHSGFSLWSISRSVFKMVFMGGRGSGSTLTQQFVKNSILTNERSVIRKVKELLLARKIEKTYSKNEILQLYLNEIPYGGAAYGVEAASKKYFGKHVKDINISEAALLAAIVQAPTRYSPYGSNKELLIGRQQYIIGLMEEQGYITEEQANYAKEFEIKFKKPGTNIKAPHFVMYIKEILSEKYGEKMLEQGGLKIYTTLDLYKQEIAEKIIEEHGEKNSENFNASNAALLSIDPKTGQILTMVGSRDYFNDEIDGQVNITTSIRQPGSSMKPLVYASAFTKGFTPDSIFYDVVTNFSNNEDEPYEPHNYDDTEHGPVNIRKALAGSLNIPAVKALYIAGVQNVLDLAKDLGYSTFEDRDRFGLSLVLGGGEVKMIEHVNAYSVFAREGLVNKVSGILKIEDVDGKIIEEFETEEEKVLDPLVARQINNILSDNNARAYAFGIDNWLTLNNRPVAAKTGTTNDYRDAWTIGFTPSIVTGVWVGNNNNSEMKKGAAGGVVAAPIWHDFMKEVLGDTPVENFKDIETKETGVAILDGKSGMDKIVKIDSSSGLLATELTPIELVVEKVFSEPHSVLHFIDKENPLVIQNNYTSNDSQYILWEEAIKKWAETEELSTSTAPTEFDNIHLEENKPEVSFIKPLNNENITDKKIKFLIRATAKRDINRADYYINNNLIGTSFNYPYSLTKEVDFLSNGFHNLSVQVCDDVENCTSKNIEFNLLLDNNISPIKVTTSITNPTKGVALSNIDFPLTITNKINYPKTIANIQCYYIDENNNELLINKIEPINNLNEYCVWEKIPKSGTYYIFNKTKTWGGSVVESEKIILIINKSNTEEIKE
jgi:1A family penicillin-binding protein